ncbi:MAG: cyclic nucleotide-binding domain-containing protein [Magnetococcales bacterium]|nr:cyclic nucleotide-binding domain-containing protein [Magnetococcales bacterium]
MQFIKNPLGLFKKAGEEEKKGTENAKSLTHPDLQPNCFYALPNQYTPVVISSQGISCHIEYGSRGDYNVTTYSKDRNMGQESLNARDRKKRLVTSFAFKGLIGVHLHPAGMVLTLDEEKNFRGEARHNQPPATIVSGPTPPNDEQLKADRIMTIDLTRLSEENPLLIASNNRLLHMMVKPLGTAQTSWGVYLSTNTGVIRPNALAALVLKRGSNVCIDRNFLIRLAASPNGGITARAWNVETIDPILMRLAVDAEGVLTLEELFTTHGLSVVVGDGKPVRLGLVGDGASPQENELRNQCAETLGKLRDRARSGVAEQGQEGALQAVRDQILTEVAKAIRKETPDGVVVLALELAVKEIIAPLYNEATGNEHISSVDHETVALLNAITDALTGWVQADSTIALAAAAIDQVITEIADALPMEGLDAMMRQALPKIQAQSLDEERIHHDDLCQSAKKWLTTSSVTRDMRHFAKEISRTDNKGEQGELTAALEKVVNRMMREAMVQAIVRLSVKGHLIRIEQEKRKELGVVLQSQDVQPVGSRDLVDIIDRYNQYALYIDPAFQERVSAPLNAAIKDFQKGTIDDQAVAVETKGFVSYLALLRNSGGKIDADATPTMPAFTCLHSIPDAIPDIQVEQPDRAAAKGVVRVVHREGRLLESDFVAVARASDLPPGVPSALWFAFRDFTVRFVAFHLTGDFRREEDRKQYELIVQQFTHRLLLKLFNLFRGLKSLPIAGNLDGIQELLGAADGVVETRLGENPEDELLDLRNRPGGITETAMNLKYELRQHIVKLQKDVASPSEAFRFKQRMRAFATAGGRAQDVTLPVTITAQRGEVTIEVVFDGQPFKKSVRLAVVEDKAAAGTAVEKPASEAQKGEPAVKEEARVAAVRKQTGKLSRQGILQLLDGLEFFKDFSSYEKERVAEFDVSFKLIKPLEVLIQENTKDTAFFILIKGRVAAVRGPLAGKKKVLFSLEAGDIIGELAFLTGTPRTLNIVSQQEGLVFRVDQELLGRLSCNSREKFKDKIIHKLVQRMADTTNWVRELPHLDSTDPLLTAQDREGADRGVLKKVSREEGMAIIDRIKFFDLFSADEKRLITANDTSFLTYPAGTYVIREGDTDTAFFVLIDGQVTVIKGETELVDFGPGEFFGDMAFLTSLPRTSGVRSKTEILALRVDQRLLKQLSPEIREKLKDRFIHTLCERLIQTTGRVNK